MYKAKKYNYLLDLPGFSRELMKTHITLYQGYVKNTNEILCLLEKSDECSTLCVFELKRRFGWEFSGMRLHEYYFDNMGCQPLAEHGELAEWICKCFGDVKSWRKDFMQTGLMRGIGWVVLYRDNHTGRLMNCWIEQHDQNQLAGCQPLLVMDVWEHAYLCEFGLNRQAYMDAFFNVINWKIVEKRFQFIAV